MKKKYRQLSQYQKNFSVDWSLEPTVCVMCGVSQECKCEILNCEKCLKYATECICFDNLCDKCQYLPVDCKCSIDKDK